MEDEAERACNMLTLRVATGTCIHACMAAGGWLSTACLLHALLLDTRYTIMLLMTRPVFFTLLQQQNICGRRASTAHWDTHHLPCSVIPDVPGSEAMTCRHGGDPASAADADTAGTRRTNASGPAHARGTGEARIGESGDASGLNPAGHMSRGSTARGLLAACGDAAVEWRLVSTAGGAADASARIRLAFPCLIQLEGACTSLSIAREELDGDSAISLVLYYTIIIP